MSSSAPAVIPALKALAVGALPAGAQVVLSTVLPVYQSRPGDVTGFTEGVTLQILGLHWTQDAPGEMSPLYRHEEHYTIACRLIAWAGDKDYDKRTQDVFAAHALLSVAIANNPTLGLPDPAPRLVWSRLLDFTPTPDPVGRSSAEVSFELQVQARVTSLT